VIKVEAEVGLSRVTCLSYGWPY